MEGRLDQATFVFLRSGRRGALDDVVWPAPAPGGADWVTGGAARAAPVSELPWWLDDELWRVELDGAIRRQQHGFAGERARLIERVGIWNANAAVELTAACAWRIRDAAEIALAAEGAGELAAELRACSELAALERLGVALWDAGIGQGYRLAAFASDIVLYARDADSPPRGAAVAAYIAAHAMAGGDKAAAGYAAAFAAERSWQAVWLRESLRL